VIGRNDETATLWNIFITADRNIRNQTHDDLDQKSYDILHKGNSLTLLKFGMTAAKRE
jgi:hypothetical protein